MAHADRLQEHSGIKRNKKACTECRQQKVRCNATVGSTEPCSRCRRMGLKCVISDPFKREHKRQRLSELEQEANELRRKLETQSSWSAHPMPPTPTVSIDSSIAGMTPILNNETTPPPIHAVAIVSPPEDEPMEDEKPLAVTGTTPQILDGVTVSAAVIDELFNVYFRDFHQYLPILDPTLGPNDYHDHSELLFWAIIGVACRTYSKNPTLADSLGVRILNQSLLSLRMPSIPVIKGLLLVLTWPLPKSASSADTTYAISGSLLHMAMQIGLHIPNSSQDFSRVKVNLTEVEVAKRAELWGHCILTYQRACSFKGHSPLALLETYQDSDQRHALFNRISPSLQFQLKLNGLTTRCCSAILQNGLRIMSKDQQHALDVLIRVFEANLRDTEPEAITDLDKFYLYTSRLTVQVFHFYKDPSRQLPSFMLTRMYTSACTVLRHIDRMDTSGYIKLSSAPFHFIYATMLSSITVLRLLKASTAQYMDENAKESFFLGVNIMKRLSTETNDGPSKLVLTLTQLWNSEKAFKAPDGSEVLSLRIRTRLAMSPVFDAIWWWREEFGGQSGAYTTNTAPRIEKPSDSDQPEVPPPISIAPFTNTGSRQTYQEVSSFLDDHLLAELGWTNSSSNNFFYPPVAGYGADWYSPTDVNGFSL